jgi:hypothetical protein
MNYKYSVYFTALLMLVFLLFDLVSFTSPIDYCDYRVSNESLYYTVPENDTDIFKSGIPYLNKSYVGFKEAIAFKESQGKYDTVNTLGYLGKYQFGITTLDLLGIQNLKNFLNSPELQEKVFLANTKRNKWVLRRYIECYEGHRMDGILITESGILAAAHLAGPGSVKRYLRSYGSYNISDVYGTDIPSYMEKFSGYDTSFVTPYQKPRVVEP